MIKRLFDIVVSVFVLIMCSPVMLFIALQIKRNLGAPVLFRQTRPGLHGKPFDIVKLRTMLSSTDKNGDQLSDEIRLTSFGRYLRTTSLDELPELWNVLKGEMSLVGPRPLLMEYLPLYSKEQMQRHNARPGITGWAQVNGRNTLSWEEKFKLDLWYVNNQSFLLDCKILLMTLKKVFTRDGITAEGHATAEKFKGNVS